ncbi:MAG: hypothetical protein AAB872_01125 [Patescibacteria group bacterium]
MIKRQINLIPSEMTVPTRIVNLSKLIYKVSIIGTIALILIVITLISSLVYFNIQYRNSIANTNILKTKIADLEKSEQKLVLAKDKLSKIVYIKSINSVDNELINFQDFKNSISSPSGITFTEISIDPIKTETSLVFQNTEDLSNTLGIIQKLTKYKSIILSSLGFNLSSGYLISLVFR